MKKVSLLQSIIVALFFLVSFLLPITGNQLVSAREQARVLPKSDYKVSTTIANNSLTVDNNGRYGDSKFIITPTFEIDDSVTLRTGDEIHFVLPNELQFDTAVKRELRAVDGRHFETLMTDLTTKTATIKIVDVAYFEQNNAAKLISADITAVWDRVVMPIERPQLIAIEGHPALTLTRIIIDEEPRGISKWGVQDSQNPDLINWRIQINRDLKNVSNARIEDTVPQGQVLHGTIAGHYFKDFYNGPNTHTPVVQDITGRKTWVDEDNHYQYRPEKIIVRLFANDVEVAHQEVSAATNWEYTFSGVPQFEAGAAIVYTVKEDAVDKYDQAINGFDITNTLKPEHTTTTSTTTTTTTTTVENPTTSSTSSVDGSTTTTTEEPTTVTSSEETTTTTSVPTTTSSEPTTTSESSVTTSQAPRDVTTPQVVDPTTTSSETTGAPTEVPSGQTSSAANGTPGTQKVLPKTGDATNHMAVVLGVALLLILATVYLYLDKRQA